MFPSRYSQLGTPILVLTMKFIKYSKFVADPASQMSMEDLVQALSDYLLQSGFQNQYAFYEMPDDQTLDQLRQAIEDALMNGELVDEEMQQQLEQMRNEGTLEQLVVTPITPFELMLGKFLPTAALAFISMVVSIAAAWVSIFSRSRPARRLFVLWHSKQ